MGRIGQIRPEGNGKGYRLSEEKKQQIHEMYFNGPYGMRAIAHKLDISLSAVRRNVHKMKEELN